MELVIAVVVGVLVGIVTGVVVVRSVRGGSGPAIQEQVDLALARIEERSTQVREDAIRLAAERVASEGSAALGQHSSAIASTLAAQRDAFDQQARGLRDEINRLRELSSERFGDVNRAVEGLVDQTTALNRVLANPQTRGWWGEKMLEDILVGADMHRGVNYQVQETLAGGGRPDYTFVLPPDRVIFLDSKFPLENFIKYHEAATDAERAAFAAQFLDNVGARIQELAKRDYVNQAEQRALEYVLLFIPNESVLSFIQQHRPGLIDDAARQKVVLCSPLLLLTFLGVMRQATQSFAMQENANEVLRLLTVFSKQWDLYVKKLVEIWKHFDKMQDKLRAVTTGKVMTAVQRPLVEIRQLAESRSIGVGDEVLDEIDAAIKETEGAAGISLEDDE
jgi:DNA recombination protein RmuC